MTKPAKLPAKLIETIRRENFPQFETLATQKTGDDFAEVAVWSIQSAIQDAYNAGIAALAAELGNDEACLAAIERLTKRSAR